MSKIIRKTCILKIADVAPDPGVDFAAAVRDAVDILGKAADRRLVVDEEPRRYRLLNEFFRPAGTFLSTRGSVFAFTENQNLNGVVLNPDAESYEMTVFSPPPRGKDRTEFIEGLTWFAAIGNHVAFFTDRMVSPSSLENYFGWLLAEAARRRTGQDAAVAVLFRDPPRPDLADYDMSGVSSLVFRDSVHGCAEPGRAGREMVVRPKGRASDVLKAFMKSFGADPTRFLAARTPEQLECLKVELRVSCPRAKGGPGTASKLKLAAERIRDAGAGGVSFRFSDGRILNAEELAVTSQMSISSEGGLPNTVEAVRKLDEWLMSQVQLLSLPAPGGSGLETP